MDVYANHRSRGALDSARCKLQDKFPQYNQASRYYKCIIAIAYHCGFKLLGSEGEELHARAVLHQSLDSVPYEHKRQRTALKRLLECCERFVSDAEREASSEFAKVEHDEFRYVGRMRNLLARHLRSAVPYPSLSIHSIFRGGYADSEEDEDYAEVVRGAVVLPAVGSRNERRGDGVQPGERRELEAEGERELAEELDILANDPDYDIGNIGRLLDDMEKEYYERQGLKDVPVLVRHPLGKFGGGFPNNQEQFFGSLYEAHHGQGAFEGWPAPLSNGYGLEVPNAASRSQSLCYEANGGAGANSTLGTECGGLGSQQTVLLERDCMVCPGQADSQGCKRHGLRQLSGDWGCDGVTCSQGSPMGSDEHAEVACGSPLVLQHEGLPKATSSLRSLVLRSNRVTEVQFRDGLRERYEKELFHLAPNVVSQGFKDLVHWPVQSRDCGLGRREESIASPTVIFEAGRQMERSFGDQGKPCLFYVKCIIRNGSRTPVAVLGRVTRRDLSGCSTNCLCHRVQENGEREQFEWFIDFESTGASGSNPIELLD